MRDKTRRHHFGVLVAAAVVAAVLAGVGLPVMQALKKGESR